MSAIKAIAQEPTFGPEVEWQAPRRGTGNYAARPGLQLIVITQPTPRYDDVVREVRRLERLNQGWDGHDGLPTQPEPIRQALTFVTGLESVYRGIVAPPMVGPLPDGSLAFVWRDEMREVEIVFSPDGTAEYAVSDRNGAIPAESREGVDLDFLLSTVVPKYLIA